MEPEDLLDRAQHYRELATLTADEWAKRALIDIAEGYDLAEKYGRPSDQAEPDP